MALAANALTTVADLKTYLGITVTTDDTLIETIINNVSDQIERWCDRKFVASTFKEYITARGDRTLAVDNPPIISVDVVAFGTQDAIRVSSNVSTDLMATVAVEESQVRLYRVASDGTATATNLTFASYPTTATLTTAIAAVTGYTATKQVDAPTFMLHRTGGREVMTSTFAITYPDDAESDYRVDYERGLLHIKSDAFPRTVEGTLLNNRFPNQFESVFIQYSGGYSTIPNALVQAAFELCSDAYQGRDKDRSIQSESIGDYSYSLADPASWPEHVMILLAPFRRIR